MPPRKQVGAAQRVGYPARAPSASAMCRHASRCGVERGRCRTTRRTERTTWTPSFSSRSRSHVTLAAGTRSTRRPQSQFLHEHVGRGGQEDAQLVRREQTAARAVDLQLAQESAPGAFLLSLHRGPAGAGTPAASPAPQAGGTSAGAGRRRTPVLSVASCSLVTLPLCGEVRQPARPRSAASATANRSLTAAGFKPKASATARATTDQRGGRRFDGLVEGQASHANTSRSPFSGLCLVAHL